MNEFVKKNRLIVWISVLIMIVAVIISVKNLMDANNNRSNNEEQKVIKDAEQYNVDKLKYRLNSPIDDSYIERVAREKLGMYYPDEIIYFNELD